MGRIVLFILFIYLVIPINTKGQGEDCATAAPFCTGTTYTFPASTNTVAPSGPDYDCLITQPNPAWYYLQIASSGDVQLGISQVDGLGAGTDVDFICWGPFTSPDAGCASGLNSSSVVDCSYSTAAIETCDILGAQTGEFYLLLLTNFESTPADITLVQSNVGAVGAGSTNCDILCTINSVSASPSQCSNSTFSLSGYVAYTNAPQSGTLTISTNCSNVTQVINAPFPSDSVAYNLTGLPCTGSLCAVTAVFSADEFCTNSKTFNAPGEEVIDCNVTASNNGPFCARNTLTLTAVSIPNVTYSWEGPNGYTSNIQNPVIEAIPQSMQGDYIVTVTHQQPACVSKDTTTVVLYPTAEADFIVTPNEIYVLEPTAYFNNLSDSSTTWLWEFGDTTTATLKNPNHTYADAGAYDVTLFAYNASGCNDSVTHTVVVQDIVTLYIPKAFTPNANGTNETFVISAFGIVETAFEFAIFDRWGNQLFKTNNMNEGWNGTKNNTGEKMQVDVYVYRLQYKDIIGKMHTATGHVSLLR
ncbi:MAG: gliding motility-associated C-terminal domain-containing protein [Bacteroidia bacterium]